MATRGPLAARLRARLDQPRATGDRNVERTIDQYPDNDNVLFNRMKAVLRAMVADPEPARREQATQTIMTALFDFSMMVRTTIDLEEHKLDDVVAAYLAQQGPRPQGQLRPQLQPQPQLRPLQVPPPRSIPPPRGQLQPPQRSQGQLQRPQASVAPPSATEAPATRTITDAEKQAAAAFMNTIRALSPTDKQTILTVDVNVLPDRSDRLPTWAQPFTARAQELVRRMKPQAKNLFELQIGTLDTTAGRQGAAIIGTYIDNLADAIGLTA